MFYQDKNTNKMLILLVKSIYVDYHQFVAYNSKYILGYEYKWCNIYFSSIAKIGQNQGEYNGWPYDHVYL